VANGLPYNVQYNVLQVSPAGNPTPIASGLLGAGLQQLRLPTGLTIGGTANASLCLANPGDSTIQSLTYANGSWPSTFTSLAGTSGLTGYVNGTGGAALFNTPTAVTFGNGVLYVADTGNNAIRVITQTLGVQVATLAGNSAGTAGYGDGTGGAALFNGPQGLAMDPSGNNLLVADTNNNVIRSITPQSVVTTLAGDPTRTGGSADGPALAGARFDHPTALAADPVSGNIYVADTYNQTIRMLTPDGVVTTIVGTPENGQNGSLPSGLPGTLAFPRGIAVDNSLTSQGDLLITLADVVLRVHFN
jgi:DNA-binding beta-propeller fold protein YncE